MLKLSSALAYLPSSKDYASKMFHDAEFLSLFKKLFVEKSFDWFFFGKCKICYFQTQDHIHNTSFSLQLMNGPDKLECYITLSGKGKPWANNPASWAISKLQRKWTVVNSNTNYIHNTSFSSQLMNGPDKLEYYITISGKGKPWTNTLASWAICKLQRKWTVVNTSPGPYSQHFIFSATYGWAR
jgi:hypothetical protein